MDRNLSPWLVNFHRTEKSPERKKKKNALDGVEVSRISAESLSKENVIIFKMPGRLNETSLSN